jgi:hypothetical protein
MLRTSQTLLLASLLAGSAFGQCFAVTTLTSSGNGQSGTMFDVTNISAGPISIGSFDQCFFGAGTSAFIEIHTKTGTWNGFETTPSAWTLVGTTTSFTHGIAPTLDAVPIPVNVTILPGATQAFYITGDVATTVAYTTGVGQLGSIIGSDSNLQVTAGVGVPYPFLAPFGLPTDGRLWNGQIHYCPSGSGTVLATNTVLGVGCGQAVASFYESFANSSALDLANTTLTWFNTGSGYTVVNSIPGTFVPPSGTAINIAAGFLDGEQAVTLSAPMPVLGGTTSTLNVCTKGYIATAPGNGIDFTPTSGELLAFPQTTWACWHDYNQTAAGSGLILFEEVGGIAYVTWNGVYSFPAITSPSTVQFQFDVATGNVTLVIGAFSTGSPDAVVVGFSPGGAGPNPGSVDISATPVISLAFPESSGLALAGTSRPIIGTSWGFNTTGIPATGTIGIEVFGLSDPNIADLGFIGAPGCGLRASLDVLNAWLVAGSSHAYSLSIPNNLTLLNAHVFTTTAVLVPGVNLLFGGTITSNGIDGLLGDF